MLQTIREYTQGWIAGVIISIIIMTFALWGIHSYFYGAGTNNVVAEVNGVEITKEQLSTAYGRLRRQAQNQLGVSTAQQNESALKSGALKGLVETEVLMQAATRQHFLISNAQIDGYLQSMPEFQVDGVFSVDRFNEVLSSTMISTSEFLELIKQGLLIGQPKLGIVFTSFSVPEETTYTISVVNQERDIAYAIIPLQSFLSQPITISPQQIEAYYKDHQAEFMTPEQVSIDYIELSRNNIATSINPSDETLRAFYNENVNSYAQPMQWKLATIQIPVSANATQEDLIKAGKLAQETLLALKKGGDFKKWSVQYPGEFAANDWMTLSHVPTELQKATADLSKPGQLSGLIKTEHGFVIMKAIDVSEPKMLPFEMVKEKVREAYVRQHAEEKLAELREQLADLTYEHPDTLQNAAQTLNAPVKTSELFTREKGGKDISENKKVRTAAFSNDVLNLQNNSEVLQVNPETLVVVRVKSHVASALMPLKDVSQHIEAKLKAQEAEKLAGKQATDLSAKLQAGANPTEMLIRYSLIWTSTGFIGRYSTKVDTAILDLAFRLPHPQGDKAVYGTVRLPSGYAIVKLNAVKDGTLVDSKQYAVFAEQVQNSQGVLEYELYKQSQVNNAKVKMQE